MSSACNGLADEPQLGLRMHGDIGQAGIHGIGQRVAAHELLHHAIFERMKTDHGQPAVRRQALERSVERGLEFLQLAVDVDAQRLENASRRMLVPLGAARDARDHLGKLQRALERLGLAVRDDGARDARRHALLAKFTKNADQFLERRAVDHVGGAHPLARRHAHVERAVLHEAEAARRVVDLRRGNAEVEENAVELESRLNLIGNGRER